MDRIEKEAVRARDKESCRVCGKKTRDVHERLFKSLGGVASLVNSMCACRKCHPFLQEHGITVIGPDCNSPLLFQMVPAVAKMIFGARALPKRVEILPVKEKP
jgi:RNA polymerase subunit RPABC4/transcription elongation factor Spt4